jgi:hypothetical protein
MLKLLADLSAANPFQNNMTTLAIAIVTAVEELIKLSPGLLVEFQAIFAKPDPTAADWQALKDRVNSRDYFSYVPQSDLTRPSPAPDVEPKA